MPNQALARSYEQSGAEPTQLMPVSTDDIMEITDDMLIEVSGSGGGPPPLPRDDPRRR
jgi:hypothetical protein